VRFDLNPSRSGRASGVTTSSRAEDGEQNEQQRELERFERKLRHDGRSSLAIQLGRADRCIDFTRERCRELAGRFEPAARAAGLRLDVEAASLVTPSNRRLLETVIMNLLTNAIRYTPAGGRIELRVQRRRGELAVVVEDTGIGIAPEHREHIFDRLYRVDGARDRVRGGSGLGLAIAQRAAQELGGRIELESELGTGSVFRLILLEQRMGAGLSRRSRAPAAPRGSAS
jgi:signal transduction histidine kinase